MWEFSHGFDKSWKSVQQLIVRITDVKKFKPVEKLPDRKVHFFQHSLALNVKSDSQPHECVVCTMERRKTANNPGYLF